MVQHCFAVSLATKQRGRERERERVSLNSLRQTFMSVHEYFIHCTE